MRRSLTETVRRTTPAELPSPRRRPALDLTLHVRTITPVVGGGVESNEPDPHDPIRSQALRGAFRFWWRTLQWHHGDVDWLHAREGELLGGVELPPDKRGGEPKALRGRVRISVSVADDGALQDPFSLARQRSTSDGSESDLVYALFPLKRDRLPVRVGLRFALRLQLFESTTSRCDGIAAPEPELQRDVDEVVAALGLWLTFGGVGARTRRGFGALMLEREEGYAEAAPRPRVVLPPAGGFASPVAMGEWLRAVRAPFARKPRGVSDRAARTAPSWPVVAAGDQLPVDAGMPGLALLVLADQVATPIDVLLGLVGSLRQFRQGEGFARRRGSQRNRPGRTYWPEADAFRLLYQQTQKGRGRRLRHDPEPKVWPGGRFPAPRAGFGLPVNVAFKDRDDKPAGGQILAPGRSGSRARPDPLERWPSPLLLRPLALQPDGSHERAVPGLVWFRNAAPKEGVAKQRRHRETTATSWPTPYPSSQVAELVQDAGGDAVLAFLRWLQSQHDCVTDGLDR